MDQLSRSSVRLIVLGRWDDLYNLYVVSWEDLISFYSLEDLSSVDLLYQCSRCQNFTQVTDVSSNRIHKCKSCGATQIGFDILMGAA